MGRRIGLLASLVALLALGEGIPVNKVTGLISQSGNFFSGDEVHVFCAALSDR